MGWVGQFGVFVCLFVFLFIIYLFTINRLVWGILQPNPTFWGHFVRPNNNIGFSFNNLSPLFNK
jgi:hypothetical protein